MLKKYHIKTYIVLFYTICFLYIYFIKSGIKLKDYTYKYTPNYFTEYKELLEEINIVNEYYTVIYAKAYNPSISKITNKFIINKGLNSNITKYSYVVNDKGLIGYIDEVYNDYSIIKTIESNNISIPVEINNCFATLKNTNNYHIISDLVSCNNINEGDSVFTSKYSSSMSNIYIGKVSKIKDNKIYVKYEYNPNKIKYVGVLK